MTNLTIIDITGNSAHGRIKKRFDAILGRASIRSWLLEEFTRGWTSSQISDLQSKIRDIVNRTSRPSDIILVDAEMIRSFLYSPVPKYVPGKPLGKDQAARLKNTDCGAAVAIQIPVMCTGMTVNDKTQHMLEMRSLVGEYPPKYARAAAHGPTYGTLLVKVVRKIWKDGKFAGPAIIKMAVVCNNCLELFCGDLVEGKRMMDQLPQIWVDQQHEAVEALRAKHVKALNTANSTMPRSKDNKRPSPRSITNANETDGTLADQLMACTVVQLRSRLKELQLPTSGVKSELVERLVNNN